MTVGTRSAQRTRLRRFVGREGQTALISDGTLDECLDDALRVINLRMPVIGVSSFQTVVDQQAYTVALPANGLAVRRVYYGDGVTEAFSCVWPGFIRLTNEQGAFVMEDPALVLAMYQNRSIFDQLASRGATVEPPNTVYLIPKPDTVRAVYYTYSRKRFADVENVDDQHETAYMEYAKHLLHAALATGAGAVSKVVSETGVELTTRASAAHEEASQRCYKKFIESLPPIPKFRAWA
jgi:hypothetical protein